LLSLLSKWYYPVNKQGITDVKNIIIALCLTGSLLIILSTIQFGEAITMFLLAGVIPGTTIEFSPSVTILLCGILGTLVIARVATPQIAKLFPKKSLTR